MTTHRPHYIIFLLAAFLGLQRGTAQDMAMDEDSMIVLEAADDKNVREQVLNLIDQERAANQMELTQKITELDQKIKEIDLSLEQEKNTKQKLSGLVERVQTLEAIQEAMNQKELNVYQRNYQSGVINLVSMERELKPLLLFNSSRDFFTSLTYVSNPTSYEGYQEWFKGFKEYINKNQEKDPSLKVLSNLINLTGDMSKGAPLTGPLTEVLFSGMNKFVQSIGKSKKELKEKSIKMFELTMVLSQFTHDQQLIETEWESIHTELQELQKIHQQTLKQNFRILKADHKQFEEHFTRESDAKKRLEYLNALAKRVEKNVQSERSQNPDHWKENYYFEMSEIQSLKVRFGTITYRIKENIGKYEELLTKYENDKYLKERVGQLKAKLNQLNDAFDKTFNPKDYIDSASKMYIVN